MQNLVTWFLERKSANVLCDPGICVAYNWNWNCSLTKNNVQSMWAIYGSLLYLLFRVKTMALLSQWISTLCLLHLWPHRNEAINAGMRSLITIWRPCDCTFHCSWSHAVPHQAPQPHDPEASVARITSLSCEPEINAVLFQCLVNMLHLGSGLLCSKFYLICFWAMLKNQAYYAQNYAFKIKIIDCFIRVDLRFLTVVLE